MERLNFRFAGGHTLQHGSAKLVGVVASGNLEVLIEPAALGGECAVDVATSVAGFDAIWCAVISDFFARHRIGDVRVSVNDNGATPAIVALRLDQAAEDYAAAARGAARE